MFRMYKPKNLVRVRAVQVTKENAQELANLLLGRVALSETTTESVPAETDGTVLKTPQNLPVITGIEVPTFEGVKSFALGDWVVRNDDNTLTLVSNKEFEARFEVAVNRTSVG